MRATKVFSVKRWSPDNTHVRVTIYVSLSESVGRQGDRYSYRTLPAHVVEEIFRAAECAPAYYRGPGKWYMESPSLRAFGKRAIVSQVAAMDI